MGAGSGVTWPAMLEMWMTDFGERCLDDEDDVCVEERKWARASWVVRIGWVRLMSSWE